MSLIFPSIIYRRSGITFSLVDSAIITTNGATFDFGDMDYGADAGGRHILIAGSTRDGTSNNALSSVSIGGGAATVLLASRPPAGAGLNGQFFAIAQPSGAAGNVTVNFSGSNGNCSIAVYRLLGAAGTAHASGEDATNPFEATLAVPAEGAAFGIFTLNAVVSATIANLDSDVSGAVETGAGTHYRVFASRAFPAAATPTFGFTQAVTDSAASFITMGPA